MLRHRRFAWTRQQRCFHGKRQGQKHRCVARARLAVADGIVDPPQLRSARYDEGTTLIFDLSERLGSSPKPLGFGPAQGFF
jgi:hypothetical protein